jgi:hypothetical protein
MYVAQFSQIYDEDFQKGSAVNITENHQSGHI